MAHFKMVKINLEIKQWNIIKEFLNTLTKFFSHYDVNKLASYIIIIFQFFFTHPTNLLKSKQDFISHLSYSKLTTKLTHNTCP